jgi:hypothetical protein
MTGVDDDRPTDLEVRAATSGVQPRDPAIDIIEMGSSPETAWPRRRRLGVAGPIVAALVIGAVAGYLFGTQRAEPRTGTVSPAEAATTGSAVVTVGGQALKGTGNRCSVQLGDQLQLGVEIVNQSATTATLLQADPYLPLGGLRATTAWGGCGQLSATDGQRTYSLPAGATTLLRMTFDVLTPCPGAFPSSSTSVTRRRGRSTSPTWAASTTWVTFPTPGALQAQAE